MISGRSGHTGRFTDVPENFQVGHDNSWYASHQHTMAGKKGGVLLQHLADLEDPTPKGTRTFKVVRHPLLTIFEISIQKTKGHSRVTTSRQTRRDQKKMMIRRQQDITTYLSRKASYGSPVVLLLALNMRDLE